MPRHPIVMADGRVPCDRCDACIEKSEAERNHGTWQEMICDQCASDLAEVNPSMAKGGVA